MLCLFGLEINGDALHASMGLPPALNVTKAKVGRFEIIVSVILLIRLSFEINHRFLL